MKRSDVAELAGSCGLGAWTAFGVLTMVVIGHDGAPLFTDRDLLTWSAGHRPDVAVAFARGLTATGTGVIPYVLAALAGIIVGRTLRRRTLAAAFCLGCLGTDQILRYAVMALVARPRPPRPGWQTHASGWAFPSGHTTTAALHRGAAHHRRPGAQPAGQDSAHPGHRHLGRVRRADPRLPRGALVHRRHRWLAFRSRLAGRVPVRRDLVAARALGARQEEKDAMRGAKEPMASTDHRTDTSREQRETHAPDHPGRRGRSRPA